MSGPIGTWKNSTLQSPASKEGLILPPQTFSFAQRLDWIDTVRRLWAGGLAAEADSCHLYRACRTVKQQPARRLLWSLFTQAGWERKHLQRGLRSDWDESNWHQNHQANESLTESAQLTKVSPLCDNLYCFSLKETHLSLCKCSWQIRHANAWRCSRKSNLTFFFSWRCFGKNLFKKPLNRRLCIIPEECPGL